MDNIINFAAIKPFIMKNDVFISYSRKDTKIVDEFVSRLESEGFRVWIDRDGIESGDAFKRVIVKAIKESALFLFSLPNPRTPLLGPRRKSVSP